jgi:hypothetical protein
MYRLHHQRDNSQRAGSNVSIIFLRSLLQLIITTNIVPSSPILVTLMRVALRSTEMTILTTATRRNMPDNGILQNDCQLRNKNAWICHVSDITSRKFQALICTEHYTACVPVLLSHSAPSL